MSVLSKPNPFASILSQAAKTPAQTGEVDRIQRRLQAPGVAGRVVLADVSTSMAEMVGARPKIAVLREALAAAAEGARIVAFSSAPLEVSLAAHLPDPMGSTALHLALELAATFRPARTLVISDGHPDDERKALEMADRIQGVIDVLYVGPEDDTRAIQFMNRLARAGAGRCEVRDLRDTRYQLAPVVRALLGSGR